MLYQAKNQFGYSKVAFLQETAGVFQANYLTNVDHVIPD